MYIDENLSFDKHTSLGIVYPGLQSAIGLWKPYAKSESAQIL